MSEHVGTIIKELRKERDMTKSRLGREADVSNPYIAQIEQGERSPSEDVLRRLAHVLRVPPHKLLIPAGLIDAEDVANAEEWLADVIVRCAAIGEVLDDDHRDRVIAGALFMADEWGAYDPRDRDYNEPEDPKLIPPEKFWGWDKPLAVPPLEHWTKLSPSDRRLIQRLANRLAKAEEPEDD